MTYLNYSSAEIGRIDRPMPLPDGYARLGKSPREDLPARSFALTVLSRYPGTTIQLVGDHIEAFARHWHGEISTAELTELTGYVLPEGTPRPAHPLTEIAEDKQ